MYAALSSMISRYITKIWRVAFFGVLYASTLNENFIDIKEKSLFVPSRLGNIYVRHDNGDFYIISEEKTFLVHSYNVEQSIRNLTNEELLQFLNVGYLKVGGDSSEYSLRGHVLGVGGMWGWGKTKEESKAETKPTNNSTSYSLVKVGRDTHYHTPQKSLTETAADVAKYGINVAAVCYVCNQILTQAFCTVCKS